MKFKKVKNFASVQIFPQKWNFCSTYYKMLSMATEQHIWTVC